MISFGLSLCFRQNLLESTGPSSGKPLGHEQLSKSLTQLGFATPGSPGSIFINFITCKGAGYHWDLPFTRKMRSSPPPGWNEPFLVGNPSLTFYWWLLLGEGIDRRYTVVFQPMAWVFFWLSGGWTKMTRVFRNMVVKNVDLPWLNL